MIVLVAGDVVGRPGRRAVTEMLPGLIEEFAAEFVIVNAENAAGGAGITKETGSPLFAAGAHVLTTGNHVWNNREGYTYVEEESRLLRPANYHHSAPGRGGNIYQADNGARVGVINLQGRTFMQAIEDPFRIGSELTNRMRPDCDVLIIDFHAEATSEKIALGVYLDGQVSCVFGTHTHVPTADEQILPKGTAYITDVGMTGPTESIIGMRPAEIIERFLTGMPKRYEVANGPAVLNGLALDLDESTGLARKIERIRRFID
ncbi:MAG: TIGR00282 family metallophosphoesterase [Armatimonadota bacterium]